VQNLLRYSDDTAGGLMTTVFVSARPEWTAEKMITEIKNLSDDVRILLYIYVTKENGEYCGSVSLRRLITADKNTLLQDIMKPYNDLAVLYLSQDINEVIDVMTKYNLYTAAVLDDNKKILGIVTIDDVMRHLKPNA
jgi:magnesium transporter